MLRDRLAVGGVIVTIALVALSQVRRADAIPAFARRYKLSCTSCHAPFPRLNEFGAAFEARGFRLDDAAKEPADTTLDAGDPLLQLSSELPLAVRLDLFSSWKELSGQPSRTDFEWPWALKLISGGPITDRVSYYFYGIFEEGEPVKLEDTFLLFHSIFRLPLDLTVGQFQVSDPVFKRELRLERNTYSILETRVGNMPTDLTYDRGLALTWHAPAKIEVVAQAVNGNGIDAAASENFDNNAFKNTSLRVSRWFGRVRLGALGYWGKETTGGVSSRVSYLGPDVVANLGLKWQLNLVALERSDTDPFFAGRTGPELRTRGGFAELLYFPSGEDGRWALAALYNRVDSDVAETGVENASLTVNYLLARNLRVLGEVAHDLGTGADRLTLGLVTAF